MDRSLGLVAIGGSLHPAAVPSANKIHPFSVSEVKAIAVGLKDLTGVVFQPTDLVDTKKSKAEYRYYDLAATPRQGEQDPPHPLVAREEGLFPAA